MTDRRHHCLLDNSTSTQHTEILESLCDKHLVDNCEGNSI